MLKVTLWLLSLSIFSVSANHLDTHQSSSFIAPLAKNSLLLDIDVISNNRLVTVGEFGHILFSNDGSTWQQANVPIRSTLTGVFFLNDNIGWAVGHDAAILHTQDGGNTWLIQQYLPELEKPLFDIIFKNSLEGVAIGSYGLFFRTTDGGKTWLNEFHDSFLSFEDVEYLNELKEDDEEAYLDEISGILPHFNRIKRDGDTLYLVGEIGLIAKSDDFGLTWSKFDEIYHGSFFDIVSFDNQYVFACGLRGHLFYSHDNAKTWQKSETNTTALLNTIITNNRNTLYVLGNNGVLIKSIDGGKTFTQYNQADGKSLIDGVWFKEKLIVVSDVGIKQITLLK